MTDSYPFPHGERINLDFEGSRLVAWRAGTGPIVLMVHGWQGTAADMQAFVEPLGEAGFSVVAVDLPAHGASEGVRASLGDFVRALQLVVGHIGAIHAVISHSASGPAVVELLKAGCSAKAAVLISPLARYLDIAAEFGMTVGLGRNGTMQMFGELRAMGVDVTAFDAVESVRHLGLPALIVHSDDDPIFSPVFGKELASAWPKAKFMQVHGLGHKKILSSPDVVSAVVSFIRSAHRD